MAPDERTNYPDLVLRIRNIIQAVDPSSLELITVRERIATALVVCALRAPGEWATVADICYAVDEIFSSTHFSGAYIVPTIYTKRGPLISTNIMVAKMVGGKDNLGSLHQYLERQAFEIGQTHRGTRFRLLHNKHNKPALQHLLSRVVMRDEPLTQAILQAISDGYALAGVKQTIATDQRITGQTLKRNLQRRVAARHGTTGGSAHYQPDATAHPVNQRPTAPPPLAPSAAPQPATAAPARAGKKPPTATVKTSTGRELTEDERLLLLMLERHAIGQSSARILAVHERHSLLQCSSGRSPNERATALVSRLQLIVDTTTDEASLRAHKVLQRIRVELADLLSKPESPAA